MPLANLFGSLSKHESVSSENVGHKATYMRRHRPNRGGTAVSLRLPPAGARDLSWIWTLGPRFHPCRPVIVRCCLEEDIDLVPAVLL